MFLTVPSGLWPTDNLSRFSWAVNFQLSATISNYVSIILALVVLRVSLCHTVVAHQTVDRLTFLQCIFLCIYRITWHPLSKYPGPFLASITDLYAAYHGFLGDIHLDMSQCHTQYGQSIQSMSLPCRLLIVLFCKAS